jgi:hypothetical protein
MVTYFCLLFACDGAVCECGEGGGVLVRCEEADPLRLDPLDALVGEADQERRHVGVLPVLPSS